VNSSAISQFQQKQYLVDNNKRKRR